MAKNNTDNKSSKTRNLAFIIIALAALAVIIVMAFLDSPKKDTDNTDKPLSELEVSTENENEISFDDFE